VAQAIGLFTSNSFFGELNRLAARSTTQERNLLRLMPRAGETLRREATSSGQNQRKAGAIKPPLMHAKVYHNLAAR